MTIFAMLVVAGPIFAAGNNPSPTAKKPLVVVDDDPTNPSGDQTSSGSQTIVAAPSNDTCAGAVPLTLNGPPTKGDTTSATDDYQTLASAACYSGIGQHPTTAPGKDVVYSFTAPANGSYAISIVQFNPNDVIRTQDEVLYTSDICPPPGLVACDKGANRQQSNVFQSSTGPTQNQSEEIFCIPMLAGQTKYVFFDNGRAGNAGGAHTIEVRNCPMESEPNNSTGTANALVCGIGGITDVKPSWHCHLGFRGGVDPLGIANDGRVCSRSTALDQTMLDSNTRCSIAGNTCSWDTATGIDTCLAGEGHCEQLTDLDCDPHCTGGPNNGRVCTTNAFCNPGSAQNATCAGQCVPDSTCVDAAGLDTGVSCQPVCVGGLFAGRFCGALSDCTGGGGTCTGTICPAGQVCSGRYNEGDADFYSLGNVPAGNKIFAGIDAKSGNDYDWRMRITTTTSTLEFDDDDGVSRNGANAPQIAGTPGTGTDTFIKVSKTLAYQSEPYHLYSIVRGPVASAQLENEAGPFGNDTGFYWPTDALSANFVTAGGYVRGLFNGTHGPYANDSDCFKFLVQKGDMMSWYGDGQPARSAVQPTEYPSPIIYDAEPAGISNFIFGAAPGRQNVLTANTTLNGLTPAITGVFFQWRASYTGMLEICYYDASAALGLGTPGFGNWAGSMDVNCGPVHNAGPGTTTTDVSVTKTVAGTGQAGSFMTYTVTITNSSSDTAQEVHLQDVLDPNVAFISLDVDDGFPQEDPTITNEGGNTHCVVTDGFDFFTGEPPCGEAPAQIPIDCTTNSMAPGDVVTYNIVVQVKNCIGSGIQIDNTATISTVSTDPDPSNDSASASFITTDDGTCVDLFVNDDATVCVPNLCTVNDHCEAGECVADAADCDDASVCTEDTCDPATGCINDSSQLGDLCDDFVDCTSNTCDDVDGCTFPPLPAGALCSDGLGCTTSDSCDGEGNCLGTSVCDDGNDCTDDFADESNACACSYANSFPGSPCDDGDACTGTGAAPDSCDGSGVCTGGAAPDCDDDNACTADSCDPAIGCVNTPITCDDGNVCNGGETCDPASGCVAGTPLTCNDGNACNGTETCDPASGCVNGTPVVCAPPDQCHTAGVCNPGSGLCTYGNQPDGTTCDDGNAGTNGDSCQGGVCTGSGCNSSNDPKSKGWYRSLCTSGGHSGDSITDADAACVASKSTTFAGITTAAQVCDVLDPSHGGNDTCGKAEDWYMALVLNICKQRVCETNTIDSNCDPANQTVGESENDADLLLANPGRTNAQCNQAECLSKEIDTGHALEFDTLTSLRENGKIRLNWIAPSTDDGTTHPRSYKIYRRAIGSMAPFVQIGSTTGTTYLDLTSGTGNWQYDVTSVF